MCSVYNYFSCGIRFPAMFHNPYGTSWLLNNTAAQKSQFLINYGSDLSLVTVDPTLLLTYGHLPAMYNSQVMLDAANMKRIPVSLLMNGVEPLSCYLPVWQKKEATWPIHERNFSKDSLFDSTNCSESGTSSSRSSTPSSTGAATTVSHRPILKMGEQQAAMKRSRKLSEEEKFSYNRPYRKQSFQVVQNFPVKFQYPVYNHSISLPDEAWDKVSQQIWRYFVRNRQPEQMYKNKMELRDAVYKVLNSAFPNCGLCIVGSSVNGLGANTSDMDMCLIVPPLEMDQRTEVMSLLQVVQRLLRACPWIKAAELITAKVPILKFTDKFNIQVDLNINNTVGITNTYLIRCYCCMDWRVQPLVLLIKKWAQDCNINNAKDMTLSSYSITLMVIHYLQCGCTPNVLPCLQKLCAEKFLPQNILAWQIGDMPIFKSKNIDSLGKLLFGFFDYFGNNFDFEKDVMSIRLGRKLPKYIAMNNKNPKNKRGHWKYICIEEPYNRTNTACSVYDASSFARILTAFRVTCLALKCNQDLSGTINL